MQEWENCSQNLSHMTQDIQQMVLVLSNWEHRELSWLEEGACQGKCPVGAQSLQSISNIRITTSGSPYTPDNSTPSPTPSPTPTPTPDPTPRPEPTDFTFGTINCGQNDGLCGDNCDVCTQSWPTDSPFADPWNEDPYSNCRCQVESAPQMPDPLNEPQLKYGAECTGWW